MKARNNFAIVQVSLVLLLALDLSAAELKFDYRGAEVIGVAPSLAEVLLPSGLPAVGQKLTPDEVLALHAACEAVRVPPELALRRCDINVSRNGAYLIIDAIAVDDRYARRTSQERVRGSVRLEPRLVAVAAELRADVGGSDPASVLRARQGDFTKPDGVRSSSELARQRMFDRAATAVAQSIDHVIDVLFNGSSEDRLHASFLLQVMPAPETWIPKVVPTTTDELFSVRNNVSLAIGYALPTVLAKLDAPSVDRLITSWCEQLLLPTPFDRGKAAENLIQLGELVPGVGAVLRQRCNRSYIDHLAASTQLNRAVFIRLQAAVSDNK